MGPGSDKKKYNWKMMTHNSESTNDTGRFHETLIYQLGNPSSNPSQTQNYSSKKPQESGKIHHTKNGTGFGTKYSIRYITRRLQGNGLYENKRQRKGSGGDWIIGHKVK